jgi:hypothetical protein
MRDLEEGEQQHHDLHLDMGGDEARMQMGILMPIRLNRFHSKKKSNLSLYRQAFGSHVLSTPTELPRVRYLALGSSKPEKRSIAAPRRDRS